MQRAIVLKPPYGTKLQANKDGTIWLYYNTTQNSSESVVNWLRDTAIQHQAESKATDDAIAKRNGKRSVQTEQPDKLNTTKPIKTKESEHDWGGLYKVGKKCLKCDTPATGIEDSVCPNVKIVMDPRTPQKVREGMPNIAASLIKTLPSHEGGDQPKEEE